MTYQDYFGIRGRQYRFTIAQIADVLHVSVQTVWSRMSEYGLSIRAIFTTTSDQEQNAAFTAIQHQFPLCRYCQMQGHLTAQELRIQQERVRESQRRVDPGGCAMYRLSTINRHVYRVNGPCTLWHIDSNHILIR